MPGEITIWNYQLNLFIQKHASPISSSPTHPRPCFKVKDYSLHSIHSNQYQLEISNGCWHRGLHNLGWSFFTRLYLSAIALIFEPARCFGGLISVPRGKNGLNRLNMTAKKASQVEGLQPLWALCNIERGHLGIVDHYF